MAIYNKFRPLRFADVLGQGISIGILKKQAKAKAWHHSYLFFGASGTGKTTTARILASCLNCEMLDGKGEPCGECQSCRAIREAKSWDVLEVDGGRYRGLDEAKDLAMKANYSPIGNKKVYIIDECHQLTDPAWNALLKLLEEPPPHLVIILCTTEFAKIPETISSRCQLYGFNRLGKEVVKAKLEEILAKEGAVFEGNIDVIVQEAKGNLRVAENRLEQFLCIGG